MSKQWDRAKTAVSSASTRQSIALFMASNVAYVLDYLFNFAGGRLLTPADFSILVTLAGMSNIMVVGSRVIQTVVARYVVRFQTHADGSGQTAKFFHAVWRSAWVWGLLITLALYALSAPLAAWLQIEDIRPVLALATTAVLLVVRPVVGGALQGVQQFAHLGVVQIVQALARLLLGVALMVWGWGAFGALVALPVGSALALLYGLAVLDKGVWRHSDSKHGVTIPDIFRYSAYTAVGLLGYALLVNMDAVLVCRFFDPVTAGNYSAAVTLGKIVQFLPVAIVTVLFPKAAQRQDAKQDPARVLLPAIGIVLLLCGGIVALYALFTDQIVNLTVGNQYQVDSLVLGLLGVGLLLLALSNVWLFYFLSIEQTQYVYFICAGIVLQALLMFQFHTALWQLPAAMTLTGGLLTAVGAVLFWRSRK